MCRRMIFLVSFVLVLVLVLTNFAQADLIGYWEFEESSGIIAADSVDGDNDGILFGEQLEWTAGRFGGALSFPGVPDHARVEFLTWLEHDQKVGLLGPHWIFGDFSPPGFGNDRSDLREFSK